MPSGEVVAMAGGGLLVALAFLPWLRSTRAPLLLGGTFLGLGGFAVWGAESFFRWLISRFAFQVFVIQHWAEIPEDARVKILLLWGGQLALIVLFTWLAYRFVWRSVARDLVRVDENGQLTPYGRVYMMRELDDGTWAVWWRYNGKWTPPWRMERLLTPTEPEEFGVYRLLVSASRFELVAPAEWRAIPLGADSWIPTTRVVEEDFVEWVERDLHLKEDLAKRGARGHLFTQREKMLRSNMDLTILPSGRRGRKPPKKGVVPARQREQTEVEKALRHMPDTPVVVDVKEGSNGNGKHPSPGGDAP